MVEIVVFAAFFVALAVAGYCGWTVDSRNVAYRL